MNSVQTLPQGQLHLSIAGNCKTITCKDTSFEEMKKIEKLISIPLREEILEILKGYLDVDVAAILENGILEYSIHYVVSNDYSLKLLEHIYETHGEEIRYSLQVNDSLSEIIVLDNAYDVAFWTPQKRHEKYWEPIINKRNDLAEKRAREITTDKYTCYKCGDKKCKVRLMQLRGADEPATNRVSCVTCGNTFDD